MPFRGFSIVQVLGKKDLRISAPNIMLRKAAELWIVDTGELKSNELPKLIDLYKGSKAIDSKQYRFVLSSNDHSAYFDAVIDGEKILVGDMTSLESEMKFEA